MSNLFQLINDFGNIAISLTAIVGTIWGVTKYCIIKPLKRSIQEEIKPINDTVEQLKTQVNEIDETTKAMNNRIEFVEKELKVNGGKSLRDAVNKIDKKVGKLQKNQSKVG